MWTTQFVRMTRITRILLGLLLLPTAGCESLWGSFRDPYPSNCVTNPGICIGGLVCNMTTRVCESPDFGTKTDSSAGCGPKTGAACSADGICQEQPQPVQADLFAIAGIGAQSIWAAGSNGTILEPN